jgi:hypothetical protein
MHAGVQCGSKPCIASHHQHEAAVAADAGEIAAERCSIRVSVVPQYDTRETPWELRRSRARIGQAA